MINISIEKVLEDINDGKYSKMPQWDVTGAQWDQTVEEVMPVDFAMKDFLDREKFYRENRAAVRDRWHYGSMTMFTGVRETSFMRFEPKEVFDGIYSDDLKEIKRVEYKFCPENRPIYTSRWDDQCMNQWDSYKAEDCIIEDNITIEAAKERFNLVDGFDVNEIRAYAPWDQPYGKPNNYPNQCIISYYYNKITSEWDIILNKTQLIHSGRYYHMGNLPLRIAQHYSTNNSIYGEGIPKRVRAMRAYKKSVLQDILDASKMSAGINLLVPDGTEVSAKVGSGINLWNTTGAGGMPTAVPIQTRVSDMAAVLTIIDDMINIEAGENMRAPYSSPKTTLGEIEIMEEKQQTRDRAKDMNLSVFYDDVLTDTAVNLTKYAVNLVKTGWEMRKVGDKTVEMEYFPDLSIKVDNHVVERRKDWEEKETIYFKEDFGHKWHFSLKDCTFRGEFLVRVNTPGTKFSTSVQKNSFTQAIANLNVMVQTFAAMGVDITPEIKQDFNPENIIAKWKQIYEIDPTLVSKTKLSMDKEEIKKQMEIAQQLMGNEVWLNLLQPEPTVNGTTQKTPIQTPSKVEPISWEGAVSL